MCCDFTEFSSYFDFYKLFQCSAWTSLDLLSGGLVTDEPLNLNEEKAEVDMTSSALTEDTEDPLGNSGNFTRFFNKKVIAILFTYYKKSFTRFFLLLQPS